MRHQTARADFGFVEPAVPRDEARIWRNHYARQAADIAAARKASRIAAFRAQLARLTA